MVSFNVYRSTASGAYVEGVCLATDEKPVVGIANGSILFAVDTTSGETTRYMYDQNSMSWIEATLPGGGSGGGSALPEVTAEDNGDVLTVVDGVWGKAAPSGGANVLVVPLETRTEQGEVTVTYFKSTKTAAEMLAADLIVFTYELESDDGEGAMETDFYTCFCSEARRVEGGVYDGSCSFIANGVELYCESSSDYPESPGFPSDDSDEPGDDTID